MIKQKTTTTRGPQLFALGDTHCTDRTLSVIQKAFKSGILIPGDTVMHVGDAGMIGMNARAVEKYYKLLHRRMKERDLELCIIRGNHDDPRIFINPPTWSPYVTFCTDHALAEDLNNNILVRFVGGACGIDRHYCTPGVDWWPEIMPIPPNNPLEPNPVDIVIAHSLPGEIRKMAMNWCPHQSDFVMRCLDDPIIQVDINDEGIILGESLKKYRPKLWVCGHFHFHCDFDFDGTRYIVLDRNELMQLTQDQPKEEDNGTTNV